MVSVKPIRTEGDYEAALARFSEIFQAPIGTPEGDERDILADLVEHYEDIHYPIPTPSPVGAIEFMMDQRGMTRRDLIPFIGSASKVSEVLSGKRGHHHGDSAGAPQAPRHPCRGSLTGPVSLV